jgi:hypothetical protein
MYIKPFDKKLYEENDSSAKKLLIKILKIAGHEIKRTSENFYADIVSEKNGLIYYSEGEVKRGWIDDWNKTWEEIRIPERKKRLLEKYTNRVNFFIFNLNLNKCWLIKGKQLTTDRIKKAIGNKISKNEKFFHIPYKEAVLIDLKTIKKN